MQYCRKGGGGGGGAGAAVLVPPPLVGGEHDGGDHHHQERQPGLPRYTTIQYVVCLQRHKPIKEGERLQRSSLLFGGTYFNAPLTIWQQGWFEQKFLGVHLFC